jgi:HK97 family phage prohead protease
MTKEIRSLTDGQFEVRKNSDGQPTVKGYLAVYNQRSVDLGNFTEIVAPGAFTNSLKVSPDVRLLANHDWTKPLARTASGTLTLRDDSHGLGFTGTLPDTTYARDLSESMSRGDVTGCSFGFNCDDDSWANTDDGVVRTLRAVSLIEGSIVTVPAYPQTSVCLRSAPADIRALLGDLSDLILGDDDDSDDDDDCPCGEHDEDGKCTCKDEDEDQGSDIDPDYDSRALAIILARRRIIY